MTLISKNVININYNPPDGGWGWMIVVSSLIIHLIMDGITYSLGTYLTNFIQQFRITRSEASIVHALLPSITLICGPIGSIFTNKIGCRNTIIFGSLIAALGFFISFFVKNFFLLYISIGLIVGIGFGLIYVPAIVSVGYYFEKKRSFAIGIAVCGSGFGTFIFSPLNRILLNNYGINGAFLIKSAIVLNLIICGIVIRPVPIEPSEINKRKKKMQLKENQKLKENGNFVNIKTEESLSIVNLDLVEKKNDDLQSLDRLENALRFPLLNENNITSYLEKSIATSSTKQNNLSTLDLMAHIRSLQSITVHTPKSSSLLSFNKVIQKKSAMSNLSKIEEFFDFSLLKNPVFILFSISNFLTSLGFIGPFIFIVDQACSKGIPAETGDYFLATIGISNTVGRVLLGILSDLKKVNRIYLYATLLTLCGLATCIEPFFTSYSGFLIYSIIFGLTSGGYISLTSVLLVDLLGLDKLTNAFGILLVFQGIATFIGPPTIGILYEIFKSYTVPFFLIGIVIGFSGLMCFLIQFIKPKC